MSESDKHLVLVLGAGASKPYGFPLGSELVDKICDGYGTHIGQIRQFQIDYNAGYLPPDDARTRHRSKLGRRASALCEPLRESRTLSIDDFLESRPDLEEDGKYAIASVLLDCERGFVPHGPGVQDDWYRRLFNWLLASKKEAFPRNRVFVITFNYDRSLEHYLFRAICSLYKLEEREAAQLLDRVPIVHAYGSLGRLPWQSGSDTPVAFGADPSEASNDVITAAAENIRVIHEGESESDSNLKKAHDAWSHAQAVLFLGFGYHETNIRRLFPRSLGGSASILGTAEGLGTGEVAKACDLLRRYTLCTVHQDRLFPFRTVDFLKHTGYLL